MKKLLILGVCLLALAAHPSTVLAGDPDVVVVRVLDNGGNVRLFISRPDGKSEKVEFNGGFNEKGLSDSGQGYQKVIAKLYQEGYTLKSSFSTNTGVFATLVFVKGQP